MAMAVRLPSRTSACERGVAWPHPELAVRAGGLARDSLRRSARDCRSAARGRHRTAAQDPAAPKADSRAVAYVRVTRIAAGRGRARVAARVGPGPWPQLGGRVWLRRAGRLVRLRHRRQVLRDPSLLERAAPLR